MGKLFTEETAQQMLAEMKKQSGYQENLQGRLAALNTSNKTSLVAAINELLTQRGALSGLSTSDKTSLVNAINEIFAFSKVLKEGSGAGLHNSLYRGKNLGTSLTAAQSAAIRAGTFDDIWVGDYWTINVPAYTWKDSAGTTQNGAAQTVTFRVADCDYYLKSGDKDSGLTTHHVVVVPDTNLYTARMNATNTTEGGYVGSEMYTNNLLRAIALITAAFGSSHILSHREALCNGVTDGKPSVYPNGHAWFDRTVDLMTEQMVYGGTIFEPGSDGETVPSLYTVGCKQLNLFRHRPDLISNRQWYWLRNVVSAASFAGVYRIGRCYFSSASNAGGGVRPAALIY